MSYKSQILNVGLEVQMVNEIAMFICVRFDTVII